MTLTIKAFLGTEKVECLIGRSVPKMLCYHFDFWKPRQTFGCLIEVIMFSYFIVTSIDFFWLFYAEKKCVTCFEALKYMDRDFQHSILWWLDKKFSCITFWEQASERKKTFLLLELFDVF